MKTTQRLLREPLLHFFALGGVIFALYWAVSDPVPSPVNTIVIGPERIEQLSQSYQAAWRRPPSADELDAIIEDAIREEVYYREAIALGLDTNDTIVRRRLRQKMEFLSDSGAGLLEPAAGELEAHLFANEARFRRGPRLAFEQIYLGEDSDPKRVEQSLAVLQDNSEVDPATLGVHSLMPGRLDLSSPETIDAVFGTGFFTQLADLSPGKWAGPVMSGFGLHLARVSESLPGRAPSLEEIHEIVLRDWKGTKARELRELHYARLLERYVVEIHSAEPGAAEKP